MGINEEGYSTFKKCHALAYGYDVNDPTFNAYSNLYNFSLRQINDTETSQNDIEIGKMILWAKKRVDDITGKKIPISDLAFITKNMQM